MRMPRKNDILILGPCEVMLGRILETGAYAQRGCLAYYARGELARQVGEWPLRKAQGIRQTCPRLSA